MINANAIRANISIVGRGLNKNETLKYIWGGVPEGAHACYDPKQNAIILPLINQDHLTPEEVNSLIAFDRHERLHALKTEPNFLYEEYQKYNELEKNLFQRLEDSRIETGNHSITYTELKKLKIHNADNLVIKEDGSDEFLHSFRMKEAEEVLSKYMEIAITNRFGYLSMALQFKIAGYENFPIPEELIPLWEPAWALLNDGRFKKAAKKSKEGTYVSGTLTKEIYKIWEEKVKEEEQKEGEKKSGEGNAEKSDKKSDAKKTSARESEEEDINSEFVESQKKENLDPQNLSRKIRDISTRQEKEFVPFTSNIPYNMEDEDVIPNENPNSYDVINQKISEKARELKGILSIILRSRAKNKVEKNKIFGRVNKRALAFVPTGKTKVMQKKTLGISLDTDVQIVVDLSGSMSGERATLAACVCITIAEAISMIPSIGLEIIGFNSLGVEHPNNVTPGMTRGKDRVITYFFKKFEENFGMVKNRLGNMDVSLQEGGTCGGCNVDHEVIWSGAHRIQKRNKKRKIQFVISDGQPSGCGGNYNGFLYTELKRVNHEIQKAGIQQLAIGVQTEAVKEYYPKYMVVNNLSTLDTEAIKLISEILLKKE